MDNNKFANIRYIFILFLLSGCVYSNKFACNITHGIYCTPMNEVDDMITNGTIDEYDFNQEDQKSCKLCKSQKC